MWNFFRKHFFMLMLCLAILPAQSQIILSTGDPDSPESEAIIEFAETEFDFGEFIAGDTVFHDFIFTNTGDADLIIEDAKPPCTCTFTDWTREPVAPGATGVIKVTFDTNEKIGKQMKYITVTYNGNPPVERVLLKGTVLRRASN